MSFYQLSTFLISERTIQPTTLTQHLDILDKRRKIVKTNNLYKIPGVPYISREKRTNLSKESINSFKKMGKLLEKIPWIKLLAITGSVAAFNPHEEDDLDILVVAQKNRLWLTRFFVFAYLKMLKLCRTDKDPNGKICPNIFISEEELSWDKKKHNLYVAHEIAMIHPIINRDNMYFRFMEANDWIYKYFGNFTTHFPTNGEKYHTTPKLADVLERIIMLLQLAYMRNKKTTETTTKTLIHFNKKDNTVGILKRYNKLNLKTKF